MGKPEALIDAKHLAKCLHDPTLRVFDCTTYLHPPPPDRDVPYLIVSGRENFEKDHIPGADFLDIQGELSDQATHLRFMMAPVEQLEAAFSQHGIGPGARVVLYSSANIMWSTRVWWVLRSLGCDAAVLDGGFEAWTDAGLPTESGAPHGYPTTTFHAAPRHGMFVDRHAVLAALHDPDMVVLDGLPADQHRGETSRAYGRPGHILGSVNVPYVSLLTPARRFRPMHEAEAAFAAQGVTKNKRVIAYCYGGISVTVDLFALHQLGYDAITLYDASLGEWSRDPDLPMATS